MESNRDRSDGDPTPDEPAGSGDPAPGDELDFGRLIDAEQAAAPPSTALPPKLEAWRRRSAAGAILTGFALGLQEALEKRKEDPSIVMETSGEPPKDLPVEAEFEYGRPKQSVVQIRPWLLSDGGRRTAETPASPAASPAPSSSPAEAPSPAAPAADSVGSAPDDRGDGDAGGPSAGPSGARG
ncbi:MAG: hypothetical protein KGQ66_13760 [Acidobacteriota bacterium]|nr:hypothetical protein [Acidobacteriota bacterium]